MCSVKSRGNGFEFAMSTKHVNSRTRLIPIRTPIARQLSPFEERNTEPSHHTLHCQESPLLLEMLELLLRVTGSSLSIIAQAFAGLHG